MAAFEDDQKSVQDQEISFLAKKYVCRGIYGPYFQRELELFGVVTGKAIITISGEKKELSDGQMAVISSLENHSYEMEEQAEVLRFYAGTQYLLEFQSLYQDRQLPRWLMDADYNEIIYEHMEPLFETLPEQIMELRRVGIVCGLISHIIAHYGTVDKSSLAELEDDPITKVVQYIYEHYKEDITLEFLADKFGISWKTLGKKLYQRIHMDLRVFVNDIRLQKVVQIMDDPSDQDKNLDEILALCGFYNRATFNRCYERNFKYRRLQEKKQHRKGERQNEYD